jgi:hypothetical protein
MNGRLDDSIITLTHHYASISGQCARGNRAIQHQHSKTLRISIPRCLRCTVGLYVCSQPDQFWSELGAVAVYGITNLQALLEIENWVMATLCETDAYIAYGSSMRRRRGAGF